MPAFITDYTETVAKAVVETDCDTGQTAAEIPVFTGTVSPATTLFGFTSNFGSELPSPDEALWWLFSE